MWNQDPQIGALHASLLALKIRTPVASTGKLRSLGQMPVMVSWEYLTDLRMSILRIWHLDKSISVTEMT